MALINCPECNSKISTEAKKCIKCGFPLNELNNIPQSSETHSNNISNQNYNEKIRNEKSGPNIYETAWECKKCMKPSGKLLTNKERNYKYIIYAIIWFVAGGLILNILPESLKGTVAIAVFVLTVIFIIQGLSKQDVILCTQCGHKEYLTIEQK